MPKVILISGGSDGLGKAIAQKLASANQVVILAHNREKLEAAAKEIGCDFVEGEMTDFNSLQSAVDQIISKYQKIDVLVNNAGIWIEGQLDQNDPVKIKEIIDVNTTGTIFLTRAVLPHFRTQKSGQIINIISQDGLCAKKDRSVYHASKWAITGFTKCLQEDFTEENIKVTGIYPGLIKTNLFQKNQVQRDLRDALDPAEIASVVEYVVNLSQTTDIPEIIIKNKSKTNMDDSTTPVIDLNIDPDLITPQGSSPQVVPTAPVTPTPATPIAPVSNPGVIDITPGSSVDLTDIKPIDITPSSTSTPPAPEVPAPVSDTPTTPAAVPTPAPQTAPIMPTPETPAPETPAAPVSDTPATPTIQPSALAEDPDLVKLVR